MVEVPAARPRQSEGFEVRAAETEVIHLTMSLATATWPASRDRGLFRFSFRGEAGAWALMRRPGGQTRNNDRHRRLARLSAGDLAYHVKYSLVPSAAKTAAYLYPGPALG